MLNIILIMLLIGSFLNYIFRRNIRTSLNCGIFGWVGTSPEEFSPLMFNIVGVYNDSRGGDSCGVYFNRGVITGIGTDAKYEALVKDKKLHTTITPGRWPVVIGHCRKASVGAVVNINVQPVLLREAKKGNKLCYVQSHNGTITNYKELAKKYKVKLDTTESDSIALAKLIAIVGWKILEEYEGSAALLIHLISSPKTIYAFHGQSKSYNTLIEERPLHYVQIPGSGTYISSEAAPLEFIANGEKATAFKHNVVYEITGNEVKEHMQVNRKESFFRKSTYNWENDRDYTQGNLHSLQENNDLLNHAGVVKNICCCSVESIYNPIKSSDRLCYHRGFYYIGDKVAHGEYTVDGWGYTRIPELYKKDSAVEIYYLYFFYGILLNDKTSFEDMSEDAFMLGIETFEEFVQADRFSKISKTLQANATFPFTRFTTTPGSGYMEPTDIFPNKGAQVKHSFYTGHFTPLFSDHELYFSQGDLIGYKRVALQRMYDLLKEEPYLEEWGFGEEPNTVSKEDIQRLSVKSCSECRDKGFYKDGIRCNTCSLKFDEETEAAYREYEGMAENSDKRVILCHTIATSLNPVIKDLDDLIDEVQITGYESVVEDEISKITEANNKLKEIVK